MKASLVRIAVCVGLALVGACAVRAINPQPLPPGIRRDGVPTPASRAVGRDSGPTRAADAGGANRGSRHVARSVKARCHGMDRSRPRGHPLTTSASRRCSCRRTRASSPRCSRCSPWLTTARALITPPSFRCAAGSRSSFGVEARLEELWDEAEALKVDELGVDPMRAMALIRSEGRAPRRRHRTRSWHFPSARRLHGRRAQPSRFSLPGHRRWLEALVTRRAAAPTGASSCKEPRRRRAETRAGARDRRRRRPTRPGARDASSERARRWSPGDSLPGSTPRCDVLSAAGRASTSVSTAARSAARGSSRCCRRLGASSSPHVKGGGRGTEQVASSPDPQPPIEMSLRTRMLPVFDRLRALTGPTRFDIRPTSLSVVTRRWTSGTVGVEPDDPAAVPYSETRLDLPAVYKVRQVTTREMASSGGRYETGDVKVGPITPDLHERRRIRRAASRRRNSSRTLPMPPRRSSTSSSAPTPASTRFWVW